MHILIAEDDFTSRIMLAGVLKKEGYEVTATVNGAEAWHVLQQPEAPQLVILDWMMPEINGLELVCRIRTLPTEQPPYIIMLTIKGEKADIVTGLEAGANDYLAKPFDPGELRARVAVGRRMIEMQNALIESKKILAHQATHDQLTGMLNRRAILDRLHEEIARARRYGALLAIGICDIDNFKRVNDTDGHQVGDDVLCRTSKILRDSLREYDSVGRMGGEEFLVITPMKSGMDCMSVFDRLCVAVAESEITTRSGVLAVTVSIGVAYAATENTTVDEILEAADAALYRAKNGGRNRVAYDKRCITEGVKPCEF